MYVSGIKPTVKIDELKEAIKEIAAKAIMGEFSTVLFYGISKETKDSLIGLGFDVVEKKASLHPVSVTKVIWGE